MATEFIYVYCPTSGTIVGRPSGYCSGGAHPSVCLTQPYDISCSGGAAIVFKASSNIKSIKTTYTASGVCYRSEVPTPHDAKLKVDFYLNTGGIYWAGSVCYAHVNNPVANGIYNVSSKTIGYVPSNCSCSCASGCKCGGYNNRSEERGYCANTNGLCSEKCPCRCCYGGPHVHMERDSSGVSRSLACGSSVTSSTWIYQWELILP